MKKKQKKMIRRGFGLRNTYTIAHKLLLFF